MDELVVQNKLDREKYKYTAIYLKCCNLNVYG